MNLTELIFEIDKKVWAVLPSADECEWTDAGMFVPSGSENTLWREGSFKTNEGKEFSFAFSTNGEYEGDLPLHWELLVADALTPYRRPLPKKVKSNKR